ncbi:MAG: hypothetical protein ACLPN1_18300 [Dissulfurispiraceae bacterium]
MRKIVLTAFCLVTLLSASTIAADDMQAGKVVISTITDKEKVCIEDYIKVMFQLESIFPEHARTIRSIMASGRYSTCDVVRLVKDQFQGGKDK